MPNIENYEILILGSGEAGKFMAWTMATAGHRTALIERKWFGGACPNIACLPSKNLIYAAKVASLARRGPEFGVEMDSMRIDMAKVQRRKRQMVEDMHQIHVQRQAASGAELIMGEGRFIGPTTVEVTLNEGGMRQISAERIFLTLGSRATMPNIPGLAAAHPMTHIEALDLDRLPERLIVIGGGYIGLELAQAMRRFGANVTVLEVGPQLASREDPDVGAAILEVFRDEGIEVLLGTEIRGVEGRSGENVRVQVRNAGREHTVEGTDLLVATGRRANADGIALDRAGVELDSRGYIKVDERLQTTAANIWAMGDCAGSPHFTHVSFNDFRVVHENLNGGNRTTKDRLVILHVHRSGTGASRTERKRGAARRNRVSPRENADGEHPADLDGLRPARFRQDIGRQTERRDSRVHRVWLRCERTVGRGADRDDRAAPLHGFARWNIHTPHGFRGADRTDGSGPARVNGSPGSRNCGRRMKDQAPASDR
jgi:pyruvate/2-oxoglutarate dehydrogenase complex dihydrolipoamide dehydrogenase (E3) component